MHVRNHITTASSAAATEAPPASGQQLSTSSSNGAAKPTGAATLTFQEAVARLQEYWASVGCAVWQPFNSEVRILRL